MLAAIAVMSVSCGTARKTAEAEKAKIAITQNNQTARLYINGKFTDLTSHNYGAKNYSIGKGIKFILGGELISRLYRDPLMDGASMIIDNLRIYNKRELSAEEIGQIYEFEK